MVAMQQSPCPGGDFPGYCPAAIVPIYEAARPRPDRAGAAVWPLRKGFASEYAAIGFLLRQRIVVLSGVSGRLRDRLLVAQ